MEIRLIKDGNWVLKRAIKYKILYRKNGVIFQKWNNEDIEKILGNFEAQVKWFEENLN